MTDNPEYAGYDVGCKLVKYFPGHGWFEGTIEKIRPDAAQNKTRRITYSDGDVEDLSIEEIQRARKSYARKLSQDRKGEQKQSKLGENGISQSHRQALNGDANKPSAGEPRMKRKGEQLGSEDEPSKKKQTLENICIEEEQDNEADHVEKSIDSNTDEGADSECDISSTRDDEKESSDSEKSGIVTRKRSKRTKSNIEDGTVSIGEVGFIFEKQFHGRGTLKGIVIERLPWGYIRCAFSDGEQEDLTLSCLRTAVRAQELRERQAIMKNDNNSDDSSGEDDDHSTNDGLLDLDMADEIIPEDDTAASTYHLVTQANTKKTKSDNGDDEGAWLTKVAELLATKGKSKQKKQKNVEEVNFSLQNGTISDKESQGFVALSSIAKELRHGCKVVNTIDKVKIVGQVLMEKKGWVEVIIGEEVYKQRLGKLVVVPSTYSNGDVIDESITIATNNTSSQHPIKKDKSKCTPSSSPEKKSQIPISSLYYWFCEACKIHNVFNERSCRKCNTVTKGGRDSTLSALLQLVEKVCEGANDVDQDLSCYIPEIHLPSVPKDVVDAVRALKNNRETKFDSNTVKLSLGNLFFWRCNYCTMDNSFKVWSCKTCKKKKTDDCAMSKLLEIASIAAKDKLHYKDALEDLSSLHKVAIPKIVMKSLVTCIATAGSTHERCRMQKREGSDYCTVHQDAIRVKDMHMDESQEEKKSDEQPCEESGSPFMSLSKLIERIRQSCRNILPYQENARNWTLFSIEDAFLCERNEPYPLGLIVRRYFPGYGFHDGYIERVERREVRFEDNSHKPVLLYRVAYNDGDEEDLLHHEINSLRQIYDVRSLKATDPISDQIQSGTEFKTLIGRLKVISVHSNEKDPNDNGTIRANVFIENQPVMRQDIDLMKFQKVVVCRLSKYKRARKVVNKPWLCPVSTQTENKCTPCKYSRSRLPFLEWPPPVTKEESENNENANDDFKLLSDPGLKLHTSPNWNEDDEDNKKKAENAEAEIDATVHRIIDDEVNDSRRSAIHTGYDPAAVQKYISYCPFENTYCEICKENGEDHYLLICDDCDKGFHTYCLRPVVVNIPRGDWSCPKCDPNAEAAKSFNDIVLDLRANPAEITSYLGLPYKDVNSFCKSHEEALTLMRSKNQLKSKFKKMRVTENVRGLWVGRNRDRNLFKLPEPPESAETITKSMASIVAAFKYCGMEQYSEELVYHPSISDSMNNPSLDEDTVTPLSKQNLQLFQQYKENLSKGVFPPLEVVLSISIGFMVKALSKIKKHTILTEYVGQVTTVDQTANTSSDSLMNILQTGDDCTSLIIDPSTIGNMARFFSGINNRNYMSKKKANVRTRRFALDGKCRVVLFASRDVQPGEILHYDYNAGMEGKDVESMVRMGFYDTSNFL